MTNPTRPESLTLLEAGNALEPVVVRAMQRAGWSVMPADRDDPQSVSVEAGPRLTVTGHGGSSPPASFRPLAERSPPPSSSCSARTNRSMTGLEVVDRGQDGRTGSVQTLADPGRGAQPPRLGRAGGLLLAGTVRRSPRRGHRHARHRFAPVGLRSHSRRPR